MILEIPRLYIRDVNDKTIATLDRGDYFDDTLTRFLAGKASVLEFTILKREGDYELFSAGKKISFKYEDEEFWLNMMITDQNEKELTVTALSLNMEFNNETVGPFSAKEWTFKQYFDNMLNMDYSLTLGINEVSDKKISNEWTGTSTLLARLFSLATVFSAELEFVTELNPNGSLKRIVLNVYKEHSDTVQGLGADRRNETFRFGKDIKTVRKSEDASGVYTAIRPYGKDGLSIASIEKEIFDENGKLLFATYKEPRLGFNDPGKIYAPQSRDVFPSTVTGNTDKWTVKETDEMEYSTAEALFGYALGELKKNCVPKTEWEIEGYIKGRIGDTIRVADDGYKPEIYLDARITEQTISFTNPSQNKSTFSNVKELQSQVSTDLLKEMEKIIEANKVYSCTISTDNGIIFKNGEGSTTLTAIVRDSAVEVTDKFSIEWFKDGVFLDTGTEITVNASDVDEKSVYKFVAKKVDGKVAGMYEVTVTDVSDGKKGDPGTSPIITPNEDGTITIVDDEGTKVTPDLTGPQGQPTGITESETIPTDPYVGMLWKNIGEEPSYIPNATYRWNGSTWGLYLFTAENISASTLSAICANLGTVTAGTINGVNINGSVIKNTFKNWETGIEFGSAGSGLYLGGTTTIQGGRVKIESKLHNRSGVQISPLQKFISMLSEEGIEYGTYDSSGAKTLMQMMAGGLAVSDLTGSTPRSAVLTVDDIIKLKNFNEKTRVIFDAGNYGAMEYPTASNKHALGDTSKIRWIIINWAMYDPSAGTFYGLNQQSVIEYSSSSGRGFYDFVLPYSSGGGNTAAEMTIKRIRFPYENNVTYLQGDDINMGNYSKWWLMRKLIVVEG